MKGLGHVVVIVVVAVVAVVVTIVAVNTMGISAGGGLATG